jgi:SET domain-containing protein
VAKAAVKRVVKKTVKKTVKKAVKVTVKKTLLTEAKKTSPTSVKKKALPNEWVTVRKSRIHGNGVFAKKLIPKGVRIIEYLGEKITKKESDVRAQAVFSREKKNKAGAGAVYLFALNERYDIDGNFSWNPARFINHACETNCESDIARGRIWVVATKDIEKGEELHYDYGYDMSDWRSHRCRCRKPSCLGYIVAKPNRWRVRKLLAAE